jgi:hypothetical protein
MASRHEPRQTPQERRKGESVCGITVGSCDQANSPR